MVRTNGGFCKATTKLRRRRMTRPSKQPIEWNTGRKNEESVHGVENRIGTRLNAFDILLIITPQGEDQKTSGKGDEDDGYDWIAPSPIGSVRVWLTLSQQDDTKSR